MPINIGELCVWVIIGGLCGSVVGMLATRSKQGFGRIQNLLIGMAGSLVGGLLFNMAGIDLGLGDLSISFEDLVAGFCGSIIVLAVAWIIERFRKRKIEDG